ncbi:MAG: aminodeoxychorismate synthase component I [Ignavibacteria bacterium]
MNKFEASLNLLPFDLFSRINPEPGWMFFDSALQNVPYSRYSILLIKPLFIISYKEKYITRQNHDKENFETSNPLKAIKQNFYQLKKEYSPISFEEDTFHIGFAGYISYDFGMTLENVQSKNPATTNLPEIFFGFFESALVYDHQTKKYTVYSKTNPKKFLDFIFSRLEPKKNFISSTKTPDIQSNFTKEEYINTIQTIKKYIEEGEIYQVNLSQQFSCKTAEHPIQIYSRLRENNPAHFSALICVNNNQWVLSSSPELFIDLKKNRVITKPIKGTIKRGASTEEDKNLIRQLFNSEKDSAELLMITDLERNDLGKISKAGSVKVNSLKKVETYSSVHHLVSEIESELEEGKDVFDLIAAMFPGGSITGAPKKRSMEIIDELEKCKRGIYTGSIGYIDLNGNAMFNIAIRTIIYDNGKLYLNLGGGIVYDSDPEKEYEETLHKGEKIFKSILK